MKLIALFLLLICPLSFAASIEELTQQAQNQEVDAQIQLGQKYLSGDGVEASLEDGIYWLEQAALAGSQLAAAQLAQVYLSNQNKKPQVNKAIYWLTQLAVTENYQAQYNLGKLYEGLGQQPSNLELAEIWYQVASEHVPDAEEAYAKVLEKQFNAQRAKQVSSIDQLEVAFDESSIELSPVAKSKSHNAGSGDGFIYLSIVLGISLIALVFWHLRAKNKLNLNSQSSLSESKQEQRQLESKLKQYEATIKTQKRQLETLYRQFKKQQATIQKPATKSSPTSSDSKLSLACALFGFKPNAIPETKQIKIRYKQLCKVYHPDLKGSEEDMKRLNAALKLILNHVNK